ncbi:MAG: hypothetical protein A3F72_07885 [Bacteroidetes bacterium RIFCSPLOWO2_12_FULL_35_15]|nr:MAG: hypothetical protein A3F72_07885 [Bacteroidetes bacterium RIFCSPLOWO2_12_FULL_35_15]
MRIVKKIVSLFCLIYITFFFSCKKKEDDNFGPAVTISSPAENQSYNVFDVIQVNASVRDETQITSLSVSLEDANYNVAIPALSIPVSSPSMTINTQYALDNIHLESGFYYLLITASDGKNDSHTYQKIYLTAIPKVRKNIYVVTAVNNSQTHLSYIDSTFTSIVPSINFSGDFIGSSISSYFQMGYMCGNYTGNFTGINLNDNSLQFNIAASTSSNPCFTGYYADGKNIYVARYDGFIKGVDYSGNSIFIANSKSGFYTQKLCFNNGYLIAEEKDKTSATKKIVTHYSTGVAFQECFVTQDVVMFCEKDLQNIFVFGNSSGQGVIQLFDRTNNNLWNPYNYTLPPGSILSAVKIDENTYLIGHSNGTIYKYEYLNSSLTTYLTGYTAIQLKYDDVTNEVCVAETNRVSTFYYSTATLNKSINSAETVLDINLLFNR